MNKKQYQKRKRIISNQVNKKTKEKKEKLITIIILLLRFVKSNFYIQIFL